MFIFEILIYFAFAWIMYELAKNSVKVNPKQEVWDRYMVWFMLFFAIICGLRWRVGGDCTSYAREFIMGEHAGGSENAEILWAWMVKTFSKFYIHWSLGFALVGFVQILFIVLAVKKYPSIIVMLPFVMFGGRYFQDIAGAMRQMTVACGFLWASKFIYERKIWKYVAFIFIGSLIHGSSLILLPLYFIPRFIKIEKKRMILIAVLISCCIIGQTPAYQGFMEQFGALLKLAGYQGYSDRALDMITKGETDEALSFGPMMISYLLIPIFIIWYGPALKNAYGKRLKWFDLWYNLAYIYSCGYFLICNLGHLFIRALMPLSLFQMVLASQLLYYFICNLRQTRFREYIAYFYMLVILTNSGWQIFKASSKPYEGITYKVFFNYEQEWRPFVQRRHMGGF